MKLVTPIKRNGFWILRRRLPLQYAGFDPRKIVGISTHIQVADPLAVRAAAIATQFYRDLEAEWRAKANGETPGSIRNCILIATLLARLSFSPTDALGAERLRSDWLAFDSNRTGNFEIFVMDANGTRQAQLTRDAAFDSFWPKPSPNGRQILFVRAPAGTHDTDYGKTTTWIMNSDGRGLQQILPKGAHGWTIQGHPEWSPDGTKIVIIGGAKHNSQIYVINPDGSNPVRVTNNANGGARGGTNIDPSWHPDGKSLLFVGCPASFCLPSSYEVYRVNIDGSGEIRLTHDGLADYDPYYSPSGGEIAWLRSISATRWAIYRMRSDGSGQEAVIDDGGVNSKPAWWHGSSIIIFHRIPPNAPRGSVFNIWRATAKGSDLTELIRPRPSYVNEYPAPGVRHDE